jgi:restriction endonuclease Mrr
MDFHLFITTSDFSGDYVSKFGSKIVLIDGSRLAELLEIVVSDAKIVED